jgi:hypothetical protein
VNSAFGFLFLLLGSAMLEPKKKGGQMPPPSLKPYANWLLILALASQLLEFAALALELKLVLIDLLVVLRGLIVSSLQLITNQSARAEAQQSTDCSARARMAHSRTDDTTRGSAA